MRIHSATLVMLFGLLSTSAPGAVEPSQAASATTGPATRPITRPASPQSPEHTTRLLRVIERCDAALSKAPADVGTLQARAEALYRLGRIDESVRDFDRVIELSPGAMPHNWQRGIALYHAGRFEDGARQFERHREVNPQDVENAAFHFVCVARSLGTEKGPAAAAKSLIPIERDVRVPLMKVQALYAGKATPEDVIAEATKGKPDADQRRERLFYGHLYIALWHEASGRVAEASKHIEQAVNDFGVDGYMGDVARVQAWLRMERPGPTE